MKWELLLGVWGWGCRTDMQRVDEIGGDLNFDLRFRVKRGIFIRV